MKHIAIIMDGNGRWAKRKGLLRSNGHTKGMEVMREISEFIQDTEVKYLTLFAFSTENWNRSQKEIDFLMELLEKYLDDEREEYIKNKIRFKTIGSLDRFSETIQKKIEKLKADTDFKDPTFTQTIALNYGALDEITRAFNRLSKESSKDVTIDDIRANLDTNFLPEVDVVVRTGGEHRLSNFLLLQSAYAELFFVDKYWPEFQKEDLKAIMDEYHKRERRFGK